MYQRYFSHLLVPRLQVDGALEPVLGDVDEEAVISEGEDDGVHHTPGIGQKIVKCANKRPEMGKQGLLSTNQRTIKSQWIY